MTFLLFDLLITVIIVSTIELKTMPKATQKFLLNFFMQDFLSVTEPVGQYFFIVSCCCGHDKQNSFFDGNSNISIRFKKNLVIEVYHVFLYYGAIIKYGEQVFMELLTKKDKSG